MEDIKKIFLDISPFILLALTGGFARLLTDKKKINTRNFLSAMFVAGFVGAMTGLLLESLPIHEGFKFFLAGNSGFAAGSLIEIYEDRVIKYLKKLSR